VSFGGVIPWLLLGLLDELDAPEAKSRPIIVNCDLANAIEPRLTQHLPASSRLKSHEYFFDVPLGYTVSNQGFSELALQPLAPSDYSMVMAKSRENRLTFATWLMFFRDHGRFPRGPSDLESLDIAALARQIEVTVPADGDCSSRKERRNAFAPRSAFDTASEKQPLPTPIP
jgi:hypothetical protein